MHWVQHTSLPQSLHFRNSIYRLRDSSQNLHSPLPIRTLELLFDDLLADQETLPHRVHPYRIVMRTESTDESVHGEEFRMAKESHPQLEIVCHPPGVIHPSSGLLPKAPLP